MFLPFHYSSRTSDSPPSPLFLLNISGCVQSMPHPSAQESSTQLYCQQCLPSAALLAFTQDTRSATTHCCQWVRVSVCESFTSVHYKVGHLLVRVLLHWEHTWCYLWPEYLVKQFLSTWKKKLLLSMGLIQDSSGTWARTDPWDKFPVTVTVLCLPFPEDIHILLLSQLTLVRLLFIWNEFFPKKLISLIYKKVSGRSIPPVDQTLR